MFANKNEWLDEVEVVIIELHDYIFAAALQRLRPLNLYGRSEHLFDCALIERARNCQQMPPQWAGLKFFNVFGPNEYHKGEMMSLVAKRFDDAKGGGPSSCLSHIVRVLPMATSNEISSMWMTLSK